MWFIPAITGGALIELKCPRCKRTQLRARKPKGTGYVCKFCRASFKREEGEKGKGAGGR